MTSPSDISMWLYPGEVSMCLTRKQEAILWKMWVASELSYCPLFNEWLVRNTSVVRSHVDKLNFLHLVFKTNEDMVMFKLQWSDRFSDDTV